MAKKTDIHALLDYIGKNPSPYHLVENTAQALGAQKGIELDESAAWKKLGAGKLYYLKRGGSLFAFRMPRKFNSGKLKFKIIAAHSDSPCLKLKRSASNPVENYLRWGVEVYGGVLLNSWIDRDLYVAGRVSVTSKGKTRHELVKVEKKVRIPQLAIHLDRDVNSKGLQLNPQKHLPVVFALQDKDVESHLLKTLNLKALAKHENWHADLFLCDAQEPELGGLNEEFIYAGKLDNQAMCHAGLEALLDVSSSEDFIPTLCIFDHEEIGSLSAEGADSTFLPACLERVALALKLAREEYLSSLSRSFLISADMAHAIHPNYPDRHDEGHRPLIGKGPVIKAHANMRYASDSSSSSYFAELCERAKVPFQNYLHRSDLACGSTIGPMSAAKLGMPCVDVGNPMLSMHSIREMAGSADHGLIIQAFKLFFKNYD